ncbi:MAG: hypothetical protein MK135_06765 [Polyangiaceae bacterium]|nr:hypothetical protein [Polyangiaceae bacterium]
MKLLIQRLSPLFTLTLLACGTEADGPESGENRGPDAADSTLTAENAAGGGSTTGGEETPVLPGAGTSENGANTGGTAQTTSSGSGAATGSGGSESGGSGGNTWIVSPRGQTVPAGSVGTLNISCGSTTSNGGDDSGPIDCTANGDENASCIFGDHCSCSSNFVCAEQGSNTVAQSECAARIACIPAP